MTDHFIGIDVGTGSARAGVFDGQGRAIAVARREIALHQDAPDVAEQDSGDIWRAVCASVREAVVKAGVPVASVKGVGFDATCSLVVVGPGGAPMAVGAHGRRERDIIVWMDHRAVAQAQRINAGQHAVLAFVGGKISPEMETPKLLWLKENLPATYAGAWQFFDLPDWLTWRATGSLARSTCTVTCKWTYLAHEGRWDPDYFHAIGLGDLAEGGFARIGTEIVPGGTALGTGLTATAAQELGLLPGTPVGAALIDAHAGGVGSVGTGSPHGTVLSRMAYVFGTSACTMASTREPLFVPGVWGPYFNAMVPGLWLNEGGQSSAGAAVEHVLSLHPAAAEATALAAAAGQGLPDWLASRAAQAVRSPGDADLLAGSLVVVPDFLGNRAPLADPGARGIVAGLGMERDVDHLVSLYVAAVLGIGYGLRQILAVSQAAGAAIDAIVLSGGAGKDALVRQLLADCSGLPVLVPEGADPVVLGAAMLGAAAAGMPGGLQGAMTAMAPPCGATFLPAGGLAASRHAARFAVFEDLQRAARRVSALCDPAS